LILNNKQKAFTLVELLIVIAIIGIISSVVLISLSGARFKARDSKRKAEISQIGKMLTYSCYLPEEGAGEYDLVSLAEELIDNNPKYEEYFSKIPKDPKTGTEEESKYFYIVDEEGKNCAVYANLENQGESADLSITSPVPGGGTGIFETESPGWNGTSFYFQYSN
jgi:prepilin-type N-terminal cleavage/methylation domain-containing protein